MKTKHSKTKEYFDNYYRELFISAYFAAISLRLNFDDAEDACAHAFIKLYEKIDTIIGEPKQWLKRVVYNDLINKAKKKLPTNMTDLIGKREKDYGEKIFTDTAQSIDILIDKELKEKLKNCISLLSKDKKDVIVLSFFMELSEEEISQILEIPSGTVKSRKSRSVEDLKKCMEEYNI